jgi:hypothetical protein
MSRRHAGVMGHRRARTSTTAATPSTRTRDQRQDGERRVVGEAQEAVA